MQLNPTRLHRSIVVVRENRNHPMLPRGYGFLMPVKINPWRAVKSSLWPAPLRLPGVGIGYRDTKWEGINPMMASLARSSRKPTEDGMREGG